MSYFKNKNKCSLTLFFVNLKRPDNFTKMFIISHRYLAPKLLLKSLIKADITPHITIIFKPTAPSNRVATTSLGTSNVVTTTTPKIVQRTTITIPNVLSASRIIPSTLKDTQHSNVFLMQVKWQVNYHLNNHNHPSKINQPAAASLSDSTPTQSKPSHASVASDSNINNLL